jgi:transcriptional regulator of aromatic amino acid metabolism
LPLSSGRTPESGQRCSQAGSIATDRLLDFLKRLRVLHPVQIVNEGYQRFVALGPFAECGVIGRRIEEVEPNSLMGKVIDTGVPVVVDLLTNQYGVLLLSRLPLRNEQDNVIGGVSLVLANQPNGAMQPLIGKLVDLQRVLEDTRRRLAAERRPKFSLASFVGSSAAVAEVKRQVRRVAATDATVLLLGETGTAKSFFPWYVACRACTRCQGAPAGKGLSSGILPTCSCPEAGAGWATTRRLRI